MMSTVGTDRRVRFGHRRWLLGPLAVALLCSLALAAPAVAAPPLSKDPRAIKFPNVPVDEGSVAVTVTITNNRDVTLDSGTYQITGGGEAFFIDPGSTCSATGGIFAGSTISLGAGSSCTFTVHFNPPSGPGGRFTERLTATFGDKKTSIRITGHGI